MNQVFLVIFICVSSIHLAGCCMRQVLVRNITKGMILLSLMGYYLCSVASLITEKTPAHFLILMTTAMILSSLTGDLLLMHKGMKWFITGGVSFLLTHILLIIIFCHYILISRCIWWCIVLYVLCLCGIGVLLYHRIKRFLPGTVLILMFCYLFVNGLMNVFALLLLMSALQTAFICIFTGAMLFFASDAVLFLVRFDKKSRIYRNHFIVMFTYILAKFLLVQGIILLQML